ncbi:MAG: hypothetical protein PHP57_05890 [Sideroxydans sp.]|nr:hypothetical protein [Sideroxydans sp.]
MKHLHWVAPDLLLPADEMRNVASGLVLPYLAKILARSQQSIMEAQSLERLVCRRFNTQSVAPIRAQSDGLDVRDGFWLCADPVHLQLQQSQVNLLANMSCTAEEASAVCHSLNEYFAQDGLSFFAPLSRRWYVRASQSSEVSLTSLRTANGRDVKPYQPQGRDALRWKRVMNEVQMLLHTHPVNVAREVKGLLPINSLWLWGAGVTGPLQTDIEIVGGGEEVSAALACVAMATSATTLQEMLTGQSKEGLWVTTALNDAWQQGDLYGWREHMEYVERDVAMPIWNALCDGRLQSVSIEVPMESGNRRFELDRLGVWRLWRQRKPLESYCVASCVMGGN